MTGFVEFVHRPELYITRKHNDSETGSVCIFRLGEGDPYSVETNLQVIEVSYF
jgi:hypothetical protein